MALPGFNRSVVVSLIKEFDRTTTDAVLRVPGGDLDGSMLNLLLQEAAHYRKLGLDYGPLWKSLHRSMDVIKKMIAQPLLICI